MTETEIRAFSDIFNDTVDLVTYYYSHGINGEEERFVEFLIPVEFLPPDTINKKAFIKYRGTIKPQEVRIVRDSTGLFEKQEISPYYILRLYQV